MSQEQKYNVVYAGAIKEGYAEDVVKNIFVKKFKLPSNKVELYFSGRRMVLKQALSKANAEALKRKLLNIGAEAFVVPFIEDINTIKTQQQNQSNSKIFKRNLESINSSGLVSGSNQNDDSFKNTDHHEKVDQDAELEEKIRIAKNEILQQQLKSQITQSKATPTFSKLIAFSIFLIGVAAVLYFYGKNIL